MITGLTKLLFFVVVVVFFLCSGKVGITFSKKVEMLQKVSPVAYMFSLDQWLYCF